MRGRHVSGGVGVSRTVRSRPIAALLLVIACFWSGLSPRAAAQDIAQKARETTSWREVWKWREVWTGLDVAPGNGLVYGGATVAPYGHIHEPGLRLRAATGYGLYTYSGNRSLTDQPLIQNFAAQVYFADALIGYLDKWGPLTAKVFAGVSTVGHLINPTDPENAASGVDYGFKGVLELWVDLGRSGFSALDVSWNTAHDTRSARARFGARMWRGWSGGIEAWIDLNAQSDCELGWRTGGACAPRRLDERTGQDDVRDLIDYTRAGIFLRYEWSGGEISASAGVSGGSFQHGGDEDPRPYATINWIRQF